jgi:GT2 family glycosyltransferase
MVGLMRPRVSVVVPFHGDREEAERVLKALAVLRALPGDELIVADNTTTGVAVAAAGADRPVRVVRAVGEHSSYHARNVGARACRNDWIAFIDADCIPTPGLLDTYLAEPPSGCCGAVAGSVVGQPGQRAFLARYARSRKFLDQEEGLHATELTAATANLLVRRAALEAVGGFAEGIRSGGDVDLCIRLHQAGWTLERRPAARVEHRHRESLGPFLGAIWRYAAGARWLNDRHPGMAGRWPLVPGLAGSGWDIGRHLIQGQVEPALYRGIDAIGLVVHNAGYLAGNAAGRD